MESALMADVTQILNAIEDGDPQAAEKLLPLVYEELRKLARRKMAQESPDHTLQATALVHEAYIRLVGSANRTDWDNRGHFFSAAAEAMRRILVENARRKKNARCGGENHRLPLDDVEHSMQAKGSDLLDLDEALTRLEAIDETAVRIVKLRYFVGLTMPQAADAAGIPLRTAERNWTYARTWLHRNISDGESKILQ